MLGVVVTAVLPRCGVLRSHSTGPGVPGAVSWSREKLKTPVNPPDGEATSLAAGDVDPAASVVFPVSLVGDIRRRTVPVVPSSGEGRKVRTGCGVEGTALGGIAAALLWLAAVLRLPVAAGVTLGVVLALLACCVARCFAACLLCARWWLSSPFLLGKDSGHSEHLCAKVALDQSSCRPLEMHACTVGR